MIPGVHYWFLVFVSADSMWWHRWLKPGYQHCFAFGFCPGEPGRWLVLDPCFEQLVVRLAGEEEVEGFFHNARAGRHVVLRMPVLGGRLERPRLVVTCAGALAALVGMRETPLTPWRLASMARAYGAEDVGCGVEAQDAGGCPAPAHGG